MIKASKAFVVYGIFLIFAGVAGYLSNPEKAKTALMSGGTFGAISILWGILGLRQKLWAMKAGLVTTVFLTGIFSWRAVVTWQSFLGGNSGKLFAAILISAMLAASAMMLAVLFKQRGRA